MDVVYTFAEAGCIESTGFFKGLNGRGVVESRAFFKGVDIAGVDIAPVIDAVAIYCFPVSSTLSYNVTCT